MLRDSAYDTPIAFGVWPRKPVLNVCCSAKLGAVLDNYRVAEE